MCSSVSYQGNLPAQQIMAEVFEVADQKWRGIGPIPQSGLRLREKYADYDADRVFDLARSLGGRAGRMHQRPGFAGIEEADGLSRVWHALHARESVGSAHGLYRGSMCRLLSLSAPFGRELGEALATKTGVTINLNFSCPVPLPAKDTILLGHGSGGKLSGELIRDVFLPALKNPVLSRLDDQGNRKCERPAPGHHHGFFRSEATVLSRR